MSTSQSVVKVLVPVVVALIHLLGGARALSAQSQPVATVRVGSEPRAVAFSPDSSRAYVSHSGEATVKVIRTTDHTVIDTIKLGPTSPGYNLMGLDISPLDGELLYVTWRDRKAVVPIQTSDGAVLPFIPVCGESQPLSIALTPDGRKAYVPCIYRKVEVIDLARRTRLDPIDLGPGSSPYAVVLSPDGSEVYLNDGALNRVHIVRTSDDAVVGVVSIGPGPHHDIDVTPDGTMLYTSASLGGTVEAIRLSDRYVERISVNGGVSGVAVAPHGQWVYVSAYHTDRVSLIRISDNHLVEHMPAGSKPDGIIDISPDGKWLYVPNRNDNSISVFAVRPRIPPGRIAFVSNRDRNLEIYAMNSDGADQQRLTHNSPGDDNVPRWSPDGTEIAFDRQESELRVMAYPPQNLGNPSSTMLWNRHYSAQPSWSPDGSKIAFQWDGDIYWIDRREPGLPQQVVDLCGSDSFPHWSPDGMTISFASRGGDCGLDCSGIYIYLVDTDGNNVRALQDERGEPIRGGCGGGARWSPDGSRLLFWRYPGPGQGLYTVDYVLDEEGNEMGTSLALISRDAAGTGDWAPDGSMVTFSAPQADWYNRDIYVAYSDGSGTAWNIGSSAGHDNSPDWCGLPKLLPGPLAYLPLVLEDLGKATTHARSASIRSTRGNAQMLILESNLSRR